MSKKILSIALAVVMLFSVLACTVGAANTTVATTFPGDGQMGFRVVSDAYVGMPAGETVTVKVYWVHPVGTDFDSWISSVGNVVLAYNNAAYTFNTANDGKTTCYDAREWGEAYAPYLKATANVSTVANVSNTVINGISGDDLAYGWNDMVLTQMTVDSTVTTNAKGFPTDADCEVFSLYFTTAKEITAADVIGIPANTIGSQTLMSYSNGSAQTKLAKANIINNEPAVPAVVANSDTATAKMRPGEADGTVDLGITGTVNAASFTAGKENVGGAWIAPNLNAVGVQVRVNGAVSAAEDTCIYETADGFKFRAAITGMTADAFASDVTIEARTYITDADGNTYFSNWMFIDAEDVHTNAVGNGMTGIA